ncbi:MAG: tripartite tricarboxylate transporter substrate binding protein, partial [Hyphomicrobiales bacterium]|nr:tripartite tricarboxylate transporter substrate binding protein [Hyphomicrobiales bacterium]
MWVAHSTLAALAIALPLFGQSALAQSYPTKPITIVVPIAAGTGMDSIVRLYGEQLSTRLGKPVIVENRPGAGLTLAPSTVATAPADGYTLMVAVTGTFATFPVLYKKLHYDPQDFTPIALYVKSPFVLVVNPDLSAASAREFIKLAKETTPPLTYSTPGAGAMQHLAMEAMKQLFSFQINQVPYRNTTQSVTDIAAGHVSAGIAEAGASMPPIKSGKLRALAVTSTTRLAALPDVPTFAEAAGAPGYEAVSWHALVAPSATPPEIIERLHAEMKQTHGRAGDE